MLKTSEFSRVLCTRENSDVLNSQDDIYLVFTKKNVNVLFILYFIQATCNVQPNEKKEVLKMQKRTFLANPNNFGTRMFVTF